MAERTNLYDPFSKVAATEKPTPYMSIPRPDVTFTDSIGKALGALGEGVKTLGGSQVQVGSALAHFGGSLEGAGDEIFKRASAIKAVENDTAATEASVKFHIEGHKMTEAYEATKGNATTGSLDAHMKTLEDQRQKIRTSLNNDQARNMFDQSSLKTLGGLVAKAGHHAVNAGKTAARNAADAEEKIQLNNIVLSANEPGFDFDKEVQTAKTRYREKIAAIDGDFGPVKQLKEMELMSRLYSSWATGVGKVNPEKGYEILEKAKAEKQILEPAYEQVKHTLETRDKDISSRMSAAKAVEGLKVNKTEEERAKEPNKEQIIDKALEELRKSERLMKDPSTRLEAEQLTAKRAEFEYDSIMRQRKNAMDQARRDVTAVGMGIGSPTGKRPRTMEEFEAMAGEKGMASLSQLPLKEQQAFRNKIMSGDFFDTPDIKLKHEIWQLMAEDHTDPESQKRVLEHNFFKEEWPLNRIVDMFKRQQKLLQGEYKNPTLEEAMKVAKTNLPQSLHDNPDRMQELRSAMLQSIFKYQEIFHTPPDPKMYEKWKDDWIKQESGKHFIPWLKSYRFQPDNAWISKAKEANPNWTHEDIQREYQAEKADEMLRRLYPNKIPGELPAVKYMREHAPKQ
jgi:hypothetical protein